MDDVARLHHLCFRFTIGLLLTSLCVVSGIASLFGDSIGFRTTLPHFGTGLECDRLRPALGSSFLGSCSFVEAFASGAGSSAGGLASGAGSSVASGSSSAGLGI